MTDVTAHSKFSASSSHRWMHCPGSMALESVLPDTTSSYADEGSAAHWVASEVLEGRLILAEAVGQNWTQFGSGQVLITEDMCDHVQTYIDSIRTYGGDLYVEQRVHYGDFLGVPDHEAFGTSDAVILDGDRITIVDLKFGRGVRVFAERNPQLMLYALGALNEYEIAGPFKRARMVISQPRLGHHDEWECDVTELMEFALKAREAVKIARAQPKPQSTSKTITDDEDGTSWVSVNVLNAADYALKPSEDACRFCKAKATCPALAAEVLDTVGAGLAEDFDDLSALTSEITIGDDSDHLGKAMAKVGLVEDWCKAVRAEVERRLFAGQEVPGFKLVEGKRGNRQWTSADDALALLKSFRLKHEDIYSYSLKGPAPMEKLLKKDSPRRWASLQALITQSEGRPSVAPASDGRPALSILPTADDFDDVSDTVGESTSHPFRS